MDAPLTRDELISAFREAMAADPTHIAHHAFVAELIEEKRRRRDRWESIRQQVAGWALISVLSGIGLGAYNGYVWVRAHINSPPQIDQDKTHKH